MIFDGKPTRDITVDEVLHLVTERVAEQRAMIPRECKRLAEVDLPIAVMSKHSASKKSMRYRHTRSLRPRPDSRGLG